MLPFAAEEIYITSVERNGLGLINVPPNQNGPIGEASIVRLQKFKGELPASIHVTRHSASRHQPARRGGMILASDPNKPWTMPMTTYYSTDDNVTTGHIEVDLVKSMDIDGVIIQEYIPLGQRIAEHRVEFCDSSAWRRAIPGATVGFKRIHWKKFKTQRVRLVITRSRSCPLIS